MATRRKAISQLIGLITLENGVFLAGLIATLGLPLFVEIGIFFDLLVAVGVTAVLTLRINEQFDTMNTDLLRQAPRMSLAPLLVLVPLVAAAICVAAASRAPAISATSASFTFIVGSIVAFSSFAGPPEHALYGLMYIDALSGLVVLIIAVVAAIASLYAVAYVGNAVRAAEIAPSEVGWFYVWVQLSVAAMFAVPLMNNLGLMWVAIEATTLTTALLVAFFRRRALPRGGMEIPHARRGRPRLRAIRAGAHVLRGKPRAR